MSWIPCVAATRPSKVDAGCFDVCEGNILFSVKLNHFSYT